MLSMEEAVTAARERVSQVDMTNNLMEPNSIPTQKRKILEECTDYGCVGSSGWAAWTCPM